MLALDGQDYEQARRLLSSARDALSRVVSADPGRARPAGQLAIAWHHLGEIEAHARQTAPAVHSFREAEALWLKVLALDPGDASVAADLEQTRAAIRRLTEAEPTAPRVRLRRSPE
ncbi:MAG: hypothetical protein U0835_13245 [Isosphaeraceae bacterium]